MNVRRCLPGLVLAGVVSTAQAQTGNPLSFQMYDLTGQADTAFVAPSGGGFAVGIYAQDNVSRGLGAFRLRIYYDPAVVAFDSARSTCPTAATQPITSVTGSNYVQLSAAGCTSSNTFSESVASVYLKLVSTTGGGMLYLSPDTVFDRLAIDRTSDATGELNEVCRTQGLWGDVDADDKVNSRDALIALSVAVGLPANGFNVARGDVDGDGQVTSRDALGMLAASINQYISGSFRVGTGVAVACAPQVVLPRTLYYSAGARGNLYAGRPGVNGLTIRTALDSAVNIVGDSAVDPGDNSYQWRPRPSPSGSAVLFQCSYGQSQYQICKANSDGSGVVRLSTDPQGTYFSPDWSPAGDSIVYVRDYAIYVMAADGSGATQVPSSPGSVSSVAWRPIAGSRRIAYTNYIYELHTRSMDAPNDSLIVPAAYPNSYDPEFVDWSPDGDSLAFSRSINGGRIVLTVVPSAPNAAKQNRLSASTTEAGKEPLWTDQGILFEATPYAADWEQVFMRRPNGTVVRVTRGTRDAHFPGMKKTP